MIKIEIKPCELGVISIKNSYKLEGTEGGHIDSNERKTHYFRYKDFDIKRVYFVHRKILKYYYHDKSTGNYFPVYEEDLQIHNDLENYYKKLLRKLKLERCLKNTE